MQTSPSLQIAPWFASILRMPRKPTVIARAAKDGLRRMADSIPAGEPVPVLTTLGESFDLHPSTIFRILRDLVTEGVYWQSPSGRFFPAAARRAQVRGLPVCFIGREVWQWSRLYQEILEGVSEVCSANGSPLVLLSAPSLVRQPDPLSPPRFAGSLKQKKELQRLLSAIPRPCGGILLDHLWKQSVLTETLPAGIPAVQLVHGTARTIPVVGPDYSTAAKTVRQFVDTQSAVKVQIVIPFSGDPAIDYSLAVVSAALDHHEPEHVTFSPGQFPKPRGRPSQRIVVCPEDNVASALFSLLMTERSNARLFATQGTGVMHAPVSRLRFDFRRMGKAAAAHLLHGAEPPRFAPILLAPDGVRSANEHSSRGTKPLPGTSGLGLFAKGIVSASSRESTPACMAAPVPPWKKSAIHRNPEEKELPRPNTHEG